VVSEAIPGGPGVVVADEGALLLLVVSLSADLGLDRLPGLTDRPVSLDSRMNCIVMKRDFF